MASAGRDEGLDRLEGFIALLGQTRSDFQQNSERIDRLEDDLNKKEDAAEDQIGGFTKMVDEFTDSFTAAHTATLGALDEMIESLGEIVDERLGEAIKTIEEM